MRSGIDVRSIGWAFVGAAMMLVAVPAVAGTIPAAGVVFHDADGDGERDRNERGIGGVRVSDGERVVVTDARGRYELEIGADDAIVFVVKPGGWMTPTDAQNKPVFHYVHKPAGSDDGEFVYDGVEPTGELPASIDFPLRPSAEPDRFEAVFLGDPQPYDETQVAYYAREIVSEIAATRGDEHDARFAVALGDLVGDDLALFEPYNEANALLGMPVYSVLGNHDLNFRSPDDAGSDETFTRVFGPANYAFQYGSVHFVVLDNVRYLGFDGLRDDGFPRTGNYTGGLSDRSLAFVRNLVRTIPEDELVVLAMHIPLHDPTTEKHTTPEYRELMGALSSHPHTLSFSAHTHRLWSAELGPDAGYSARGTPYHLHLNAGATCGSWWRGPINERGLPFAVMSDGTPNGYLVATFEGNRYDLRWKVAGEPASRRMHLSLPDRMDAAAFAATEAVANVYMGDSSTRVEMRVVDAHGREVIGWRRMRHREGVDPVYRAMYERDRAHGLSPEGRAMSEPRSCTHLFALTPGVTVPPGTYRVEVRARAADGGISRHSQPLRITPGDERIGS